MKRIAITGGHLTPALALIEELENQKDRQIDFYGRKFSTEGSKAQSAEHVLVQKYYPKIRFIPLTAGRFQRKFTKYTLLSILKIPTGIVQAFFYLFVRRPDLIVSFGGYLSFPVVFSGWLLGIKSISHEQAAKPGLANILNSYFALKIFVSWPQSKQYYPEEKTELIGNLVPESLSTSQNAAKDIKDFLLKNDKVIFITAGNQGSHFINKIVEKLPQMMPQFNFLHQVGTLNYKGDWDFAKKSKAKNYKAVDYLDSQDIGYVLKKSKLTIARSGANTVWDLAILAKPSILIPLPISGGGEQKVNAKILEDAGTAIVIPQEELTSEKLRDEILKALENYEEFQKNARNFSKDLPKNGVKVLAAYIKNLL